MSGSWDKTCRVWDVFDSKGNIETLTHSHDVLAIAFRPDGRQLAAATLEGSIHLWDPEEAEAQVRRGVWLLKYVVKRPTPVRGCTCYLTFFYLLDNCSKAKQASVVESRHPHVMPRGVRGACCCSEVKLCFDAEEGMLISVRGGRGRYAGEEGRAEQRREERSRASSHSPVRHWASETVARAHDTTTPSLSILYPCRGLLRAGRTQLGGD